ncbi:MAG: helix-turn-helix transcriptional regulator [Verrucomicrobiae bacterium]|nr:helix-turn-helix transcriptional regulator [Verrucomicrobiae bacterium]
MKLANPKGISAGFAILEPLASVPELVKVGEQWAVPEFITGIHAHSEWEFHLQLDGECVWSGRDLGHAYQMNAFNLIGLAPGLKHRMGSFRSRQHFFFTGIDLYSVFKRYPMLQSFWAGRQVVFILGAEEVVAPFQNLVYEVFQEHSLRSIGLRMAVDALILRITRLLTQKEPKKILTHWHPAVVHAKHQLENRPSVQWTIHKLAKQCGLSPTHLSKQFLKNVGVSPHHYHLICRVKRAKELLRQTNSPITSIALELGFSSSQHFAEVFHRLTGTSARGYRCKCRVSDSE